MGLHVSQYFNEYMRQKSRDITLLTKVHLVKAMDFPVVTYGCESWTIKKAERWRTDAFELWCWRRLLRVPWTARRSNQCILKEISPEYSLEELMLKLKQYFDHLMQRTDSLEKTLMLGKIEGRRRRGRRRMRWLDGITWLDGHEFEQALGVGDGQENLARCNPNLNHRESDTTEWLNWTELEASCLSSYLDWTHLPAGEQPLCAVGPQVAVTACPGPNFCLFKSKQKKKKRKKKKNKK